MSTELPCAKYPYQKNQMTETEEEEMGGSFIVYMNWKPEVLWF